MRKLLGFVPLVVLGTLTFVACTGDSRAQDRKLAESIESTVAGQSLTKASGETAADACKHIVGALGRTFTDIVARSKDHSCSVYAKDPDRFSIHLLEYADVATAQSFADQVNQRKARTLKIESLTYYSFAQAGKTLVFIVSDRQSRDRFAPLFDEIVRKVREPG